MKVIVIRENKKMMDLDDEEFIKEFYDKGLTRINSNINRFNVYKVIVFNSNKGKIDRVFYLTGIDFDRYDHDKYHYKLEKVPVTEKLNKLIGKKTSLGSCIPCQVKELDELFDKNMLDDILKKKDK